MSLDTTRRRKTTLERLEHAQQTLPSPEHVRISVAAAMSIGLGPGLFFRNVT